jgi:hypothetical protein
MENNREVSVSIPDVDVPIGFLYETTLMKYAGGKLMKNGMIMTPEEALQHFVEIAKDEGFDETSIENSAEELIYSLKEVEERKYQEYLEEKDV